MCDCVFRYPNEISDYLSDEFIILSDHLIQKYCFHGQEMIFVFQSIETNVFEVTIKCVEIP